VRIAFVTGSLEPGKDGVGDYTRLLAGACAAQGASCELIALADPHLEETTTATAAGVRVLRLPMRMAWADRIQQLRQQITSFGPAWVSLQLVPYSFERRGLAIRLARDFSGAIAPCRLQIMLHEIWIDGTGAWLRRLVSAMQKRCVLRLCRTPGALVHTSNGTYQHQLGREGVSARRLALFGSLDIAGTGALDWLAPVLASAGCDAASRREHWWLCALFGTLHPVWPAEPLFSNLEAAAAAAGKRLAIVSVGRIGSGEPLWTSLCQRYASRW
jgi:hypothetical protein